MLVCEEELTADRTDILEEELCNLYFSPNVISWIIKRRTLWQEIEHSVKWSPSMENRRTDEAFNFIAVL
jgi:hypothetical protein